jgi:peptidoglycan/xylan/chitin deacetylase (PgdA/CDA1 family)
MEVLRGCRKPIALSGFGGRDDGAPPADAVAVTFDDGYADNLIAAKPILERSGIPATVFVTTSAVDNAGELWWDELERILLAAAELPAELHMVLGEREIAWSSDPGDRSGAAEAFGKKTGERWRAYEAIYEQLLRAPYATKLRVLADLAIWAGVATDARPSRRLITHAELVDLASGGVVTIGAHTETHPLLAGLAADEQWTEISRSKLLLEEMLGQPIDTFAYPYGSYDARTVSCVRRAGFTLACHTRSGTVGRHTNRFELPRLHVRDWDGDQFARLLLRFAADKAA